ncbi:arylsulfatase [Sphingobacterium sp. SGG-5]|uniref:sulfatase family protein n=1 Tax=Sphingobacterium sp. SGG-5 TaxID=2710881 RepID=UPI0013ED063F|nr:arylsulfatase [Sphingobacterium sp. SGG-5]NGM60956.1 arylsulfatase [Sphingobacterium sp. SGG-5]
MENKQSILRYVLCVGVGLVTSSFIGNHSSEKANDKTSLPNIVIINMDDLGYGDVGAYGATGIPTPNMDRLANEGIRFTNGYATSSTCTPSRFGMLTGVYPWRNSDAKILPGTAPLLIDTAQQTLPKILRQAGYRTGVVGKWHLGLGSGHVDWNGHISPGPNEVGFDESFIMAATQDRVPTVYIEDGHVVGRDAKDPIEVSYDHNFEGEPTGLDNPELLKMKWHHGHNQSIVNGIPRIGYMKGGDRARWVDEDMADTFLSKAQSFVKKHKSEPFFLYYAMQQPHVPRTPHPRFVGSTAMGPRGDVIVEADHSVGAFLKTLEEEGLLENTLIIFTSDNGPVLNDGYYDDAVEKVGEHRPNGPLRGGKYSLYEAGARVPFVVYWKGRVEPQVSDAVVCQLDLLASFAALTGQSIQDADSRDYLDVLLGRSQQGRDALVLEANSKTFLRQGDWVMVPPYRGAALNRQVNIELGNSDKYQLYNVREDVGQQNNLAEQEPNRLEEMRKLYGELRGNARNEVKELELH